MINELRSESIEEIFVCTIVMTSNTSAFNSRLQQFSSPACWLSLNPDILEATMVILVQYYLMVTLLRIILLHQFTRQLTATGTSNQNLLITT